MGDLIECNSYRFRKYIGSRNLRSTDTGTEARGYAYGDTGYGIFQKQPFGDTAGYISI